MGLVLPATAGSLLGLSSDLRPIFSAAVLGERMPARFSSGPSLFLRAVSTVLVMGGAKARRESPARADAGWKPSGRTSGVAALPLSYTAVPTWAETASWEDDDGFESRVRQYIKEQAEFIRERMALHSSSPVAVRSWPTSTRPASFWIRSNVKVRLLRA